MADKKTKKKYQAERKKEAELGRKWLKKYKQGNRKWLKKYNQKKDSGWKNINKVIESGLKKVKGKKVAQKNTSKVSEKEKEIFN